MVFPFSVVPLFCCVACLLCAYTLMGVTGMNADTLIGYAREICTCLLSSQLPLILQVVAVKDAQHISNLRCVEDHRSIA